MIAIALSAGRWLLGGNWKWAVPAAIAAVAVIYAGVQRINYLDCKSARAADRLAAEKAVNDFRARDYAHAVKLVGQYAAEVADLQGRYEDAQIKLARVQSVAGCNGTPAARAYDDGLRQLERQTGGGDARSPGGAGAAMPAPARAPR